MWEIPIGLLLVLVVVGLINIKINRDIKKGKFSSRTPRWARVGLPNFVTWTEEDWTRWSAYTGISRPMWEDDAFRRCLMLRRVNPENR